jgi:hypothetical protein
MRSKVHCAHTPKIQGPEFDMPDICDVLRWDENGVLQVYCCGEWQNVPGTENAIVAGGRQPEAQPRPAATQCKEYEVVLSSAGSWILPFPVNDGDVVTVSNAKGIWSDGAGVFWWYPDGNLYVLGGKVTTCDHKSGDFTTDFCHMRLIAQIGADTYVDGYNTTFTIPDGTGSQNLIFRANNGLPLSGGDITFHVSVCSGAVVPVADWCYVYDFTAVDYGWAPYSPAGNARATWYPGLGFGAQDNAIYKGLIQIQSAAFASGVVTSVEVQLSENLSGGIGDVTVNFPDRFGADNTVHSLTDTTFVIVLSPVTTTGMFVNIQHDVDESGTPWPGYLQRITLRGTGTNPFGVDNC